MSFPATCFVCAVNRLDTHAHGSGTWRPVYVDDALIAFVQPEVNGVLIAPRVHIGDLSASPELAGVVLAGLRRAALAVRAFYGTDVTVQPLGGIPGAAGHVCYQVFTTPPETSGHGAGRSEELASTLRRQLGLAAVQSGKTP